MEIVVDAMHEKISGTTAERKFTLWSRKGSRSTDFQFAVVVRLAMPAKMSDSLPGMKKIAAEKFQKQFGKLARTLKPGEVVQVTKQGEPLVRVTKLGRRRIKTPNFISYLA